jgi:hypothetical protein
MKLYKVSPAIPAGSDEAFIDARLATCIEPIADLILLHLSPDPALFGMRHTGEISKSPLQAGDRYGYADVVRIPNGEHLRRALVACGDPNSGQWMLIRSLVTCRAVFYGSDGQAFVCIPSDAEPIVSPDEATISVEECSHLLIETDYLDGLVDN